MKVGFVIRDDYDTVDGGDVVQATSLMAELAKLGCDCRVLKSGDSPGSLDLVHLFNSARLYAPYKMLRRIRSEKLRCKTVYSPIWHPIKPLAAFHLGRLHLAGSIDRYLGAKELYYERAALDWPLMEVTFTWRRCLKYCVRNADLIVPNSVAEWQDLASYSGIADATVLPIRNGVSLSSPKAEPRQNLVVCAGRIEPRKNQIALIEAFLRTETLHDFCLVFAGALSGRHPRYVSRFQNLLSDRIHHVGLLERQDLAALFSRAKVCALPSFFETTGLVGLEAMNAGASLVMTEFSYNEFYYGEQAYYCNPNDISSIAGCLRLAVSEFSEEKARENSRHVRAGDFSWPAIARETYAAYQRLLR